MVKKADPKPLPVTGPGKGRATPSRREREAARRQPLVPSDRKAAARASRAQTASQRDRARIGMAAGDERYLPARDRGTQRRFARDFVDARWSFGEALFPLAGVILVATFVSSRAVNSILFVVVYALIILMVGDALITARRIRTRLTAKVGAAKVERGLNWYVVGRSMQLRFLRTPKPQVRRGQRPQ